MIFATFEMTWKTLPAIAATTARGIKKIMPPMSVVFKYCIIIFI
jgi:hypothetical protein